MNSLQSIDKPEPDIYEMPFFGFKHMKVQKNAYSLFKVLFAEMYVNVFFVIRCLYSAVS